MAFPLQSVAFLALVWAQIIICVAFSFTPKPSTCCCRPNHRLPISIATRSSSLAPLRASSDISSSSDNNSAQAKSDELVSTFPRELPAGMRGEAVRSALRSPNGVCIDFTSHDEFGVGVVKVDGSGVQQFLEGKLSNSFDLGSATSDKHGKLVDSCLLTPRGRTVDRISVSLFPGQSENDDDASSTEAYLLTSPGHGGSALFNRLDPYVFPMDGVKLTDIMATSRASTRIITVAATRLSHVQESVMRYVSPHLKSEGWTLPRRGECVRASSDDGADVIILPSTFLPECVCVGYTFVISETAGGSGDTAQCIWDALTAEFDDQAPVELGPLEWETLRIEGGWPAYGREMTGDVDPENDKDGAGGGSDAIGVGAKASPLELHLEAAVDETKGCYLGQEAISALLKNKRGIPRTLYSLVFHEDYNAYGVSPAGDLGDDNMMDLASLLGVDSTSPSSDESGSKQPIPGDDIYVLGSAGKIKCGMITSVAEAGGTGEPTTVGLALIRRPDSILSKMESMALQLGGEFDTEARGAGQPSTPQPVDPLDGLEVIVDGTSAIGKLQSLPCRRFKNGLNMFDAEVEAFAGMERDSGAVMGIVDSGADASDFVPEGWDATETVVDDEDELRQAEEEAAKAAAEAEAAAAEAKRKAEKMEILRQKAEAAKARRRKKKKKAAE